MYQRPLAVKILTVLYSVIAVASPFINMQPAMMKWIIAPVALFAAISVWKVSRLALGAVPALIIMVIASLFSSFHAAEMGILMAFTFSAGWIMFHLPFLSARLLHLFSHPELHWWRRAERKNLAMPIVLTAIGDVAVELETFDISETGIFVPLFEKAHLADHLTMQEFIDLKIGGAFQPKVECCGRVVRRSEARGRYPAGLGIQFMELPRGERRKLRQILSPFASSLSDSYPGSPQ